LQNIVGFIDGTHIPLFKKPNRKIIALTTIFYNHKKFHNIILQGECDYDNFFGKISTSQPRGLINGAPFTLSNIYWEKRCQEI
jgi:hypothetical protein